MDKIGLYGNLEKKQEIDGKMNYSIGAPGADGVTFVPSVDENGNISWTNNGGRQNPETRNIKGPQGNTGPQGERGLQGLKGDPGDDGVGILSITKTSTVDNIDTYTITYTDSTTSTFTVTNADPKSVLFVGQELTDAQKEQARRNIGAITSNGNYADDGLGAATALNLIDTKSVGTSRIFTFDTSCGDASIIDDGVATIAEIKGNSLVWNQLIHGQFKQDEGLPLGWSMVTEGTTAATWEINDDGELTVHNSYYLSSSPTHSYLSCTINKSPDTYHKFLYTCEFKGDPDVSYSINHIRYSFRPSGEWQRFNYIDVRKSSDPPIPNQYLTITPQLNSTQAQTKGTYSIRNVMCFDLTQMFGRDAADELTVEKFLKLFPSGYYEYNPGEIINFKGTGIKTVGFNQWDEVWEPGVVTWQGIEWGDYLDAIRSVNYCKCLPDTEYYCTVKNPSVTDRWWLQIVFFDANQTPINDGEIWISNTSFITPHNAHYFRFSTSSLSTHQYGKIYNNDICINFAWSGYRNGEYEPHWERTLPLPISTYFTDGMCSAGNSHDSLFVNKKIVRIAEVNLGDLTWSYYNTAGHEYFWADLTGIKNPTSDNEKGDILCGQYETETVNTIWAHTNDKLIGVSTLGRITVYDSDYTDAASFKEAVSGIKAYYGLAIPVETPITPVLNLNYRVADFGTEEVISTEETSPIDAIIKYSTDFAREVINLRDKVNSLINVLNGG